MNFHLTNIGAKERFKACMSATDTSGLLKTTAGPVPSIPTDLHVHEIVFVHDIVSVLKHTSVIGNVCSSAYLTYERI